MVWFDWARRVRLGSPQAQERWRSRALAVDRRSAMPPPRVLPCIRAPPKVGCCPRHTSKGGTMKSKLILGAILALLLAVTSVSFAFASGDAKGDNNGDKVRILQVTLQHRGQEAQLDLGAPGPSIGDRFIFS